jgi:hypothetical protein
MDGSGARRGATAMVAGVIALLFAAPDAGAATTVGQVFAPPAGCGSPQPITYLQTVSPGGEYAVPAAGVVTSWSHVGGSTPQRLKLKVARFAGPEPNRFRILGESGFQDPVAGQLNTYTDVRIRVEAGDVIGITATAPMGGCGRDGPATAGYQTHYLANSDPPPGSAVLYTPPASNFQLDLSAVVEPDADGDGFGDESQDQCPTDASKQGDCTPPDTQITKGPKDKTKKKSATFEFASEAGASFLCSLDGQPFAACTSPHVVRVGKGKHALSVQSVDAAGNADGSPASDQWKVKKKKKK